MLLNDSLAVDNFREALALNGICPNLGFIRLYDESEALSGFISEVECLPDIKFIENTRKEYKRTVEAFKNFKYCN